LSLLTFVQKASEQGNKSSGSEEKPAEDVQDAEYKDVNNKK
jgi:hypothetical protein